MMRPLSLQHQIRRKSLHGLRQVVAAGIAVCGLGSLPAQAEVEVVLVVGAGGTEDYAAEFAQRAQRWQEVTDKSEASLVQIGPHIDSTTAAPAEPLSEKGARQQEAAHEQVPREEAVSEEANIANGSPQGASDTDSEGLVERGSGSGAGAAEDRQQLLDVLAQRAAVESDAPLWLVMIGHGTFQQGQAKFNLRGPDVSAEEIGTVLSGSKRPLVIINSASASGPFIAALSGEGRVVVTATRSGDEQNFARFGNYLSRAIGDPSADLDHDRSVSVLEAFLAASAQTQQFYEREGRLATEHALLDDDGDKLGTPADFFRGIRVVHQPEGDAQPDGRLATQLRLLTAPADAALAPEQQQRIAELEQQVHELRARKSEQEADAYYAELEQLMIEIAELYEQPSPPEM